MAYYDFPHTRNYDTDLGYLIQHINDWDDELAKKADITYVDTELAKKANIDDVDEALAKKVDLTQYNYDINIINTELEAKLDIDVFDVKMEQVDAAIEAKQDTLVSGTNIKTINNISLLGEGNIDIQGGGGGSVDIIDTLDSDRTDAALSANQGRVLNGLITEEATARENADASNLTEAKGYADTVSTQALTDAKTYGDTVSAQALTDAKAYIDAQITTALTADY